MNKNGNLFLKEKNLSHPKYRSDIDGLRAIAVLSVVIYHAFPQFLSGGFTGVDIFFVISGYLISTIIISNLDNNSFSFTEFYSRRIKRIFPALLLVLLGCLIFGSFALFPDEYKQISRHVGGGASFIANFIFWNESGYFDKAIDVKPLIHLWSLGIEEQFYIFWPFLLWFVWKKKLNFLTISIAIAIISFALNVGKIHSDVIATFYSPQTRFWELLMGSVLAYITIYQIKTFSKFKFKLDNLLGRITYAQVPENDGKTFTNFQSIVGFILILSGFFIISKERYFPGWWALLPTTGAVLIIAADDNSWFNRIILSNPILVWFGLISFPLYLWHWPLLSFAHIVESETPSIYIRVSAVVISVMLAWFTFKFIEKPIRLGKSKNKITMSLVLLMIFTGGLGYFIHFHKKITAPNLNVDDSKNNCDKQFPEWSKDDRIPCRIQKNTINSIAIIGDSHADQLFVGVSGRLAPKNGVAVFSAGCAAPYIDISSAMKDVAHAKEREGNYKLINSAFDYIIKNPEIKIVLLAHDPACSYNDAIDIANRSSKDNNNALTQGIKRTFSALTNANKKVVVIFDNPPLPFEPTLCVDRPLRLSRNRNICSFPRKNLDNSVGLKNYRSLIESELINFPQIKTIDLANAICDKKNCYAIKNGRVIYRDAGHLNEDGSRYVAEYIINMLENDVK